MTCIIAIEDKDICWMGADTFSGGDDWADLMVGSKIQSFANGSALLSCAGTIALPQWLSTQDVPGPKRKESVQEWLIRTCQKLRVNAVADGINVDPKSEDSSVILLACRGEAWFVQSDFTIHRSRYGYAAFGSSMGYALGSLASTEHLPPRERIEMAMRAAERHCPTVRGPFDIQNTKQ